ncbi:MAG: extracellular solute-binding protein [Segniliparus sp.]|uniref:extracellular solute-binding protein n=1 Tax=Segniliparus sp. TaxID=2804064 RepID=UPI003F3322A2
MSRAVRVLLAAVLAVGLVASCARQAGPLVLWLYASGNEGEQYTRAAKDCSTAQYQVETRLLPREADSQRLQLARRLAGDDASLDLMLLDVVWTAEFAEAGWAVPLPERLVSEVRGKSLPGPYTTAIWKGVLYAFPANTNTQLLWYRKDLVGDAPATWAGLIDQAQRFARAGGPGQIAVQAAPYEGLMVWFNTLLVSAGGAILAPDGKTPTLEDTPEHRAATVKALTVIRDVARARGADPSISQSNETTARLALEQGRAAFEVNWPYVLNSVIENAKSGGVAFAPEALGHEQYPRVDPDKPARVTLGGYNLAVASTSRHKDLAFQAAKCITGEREQRQVAVGNGVPPTIRSVFDDPEFQAVYPLWRQVLGQLQEDSAAIRPATPVYQTLSKLVTAKLNPPADIDPERMVDVLDKEVGKAVAGEGLVP